VFCFHNSPLENRFRCDFGQAPRQLRANVFGVPYSVLDIFCVILSQQLCLMFSQFPSRKSTWGAPRAVKNPVATPAISMHDFDQNPLTPFWLQLQRTSRATLIKIHPHLFGCSCREKQPRHFDQNPLTSFLVKLQEKPAAPL